MDLKIIIPKAFKIRSTIAAHPHLHLPQLLSSQPKRELVATPLVLEAVDASQGLSDGDIENQMRKREKRNGYPAVPALETSGLSLG